MQQQKMMVGVGGARQGPILDGRLREEMIFEIRTIRGKKSRRKDHGSLGRENSKCKAMSWDKECFLLDKIKVVFMASA